MKKIILTVLSFFILFSLNAKIVKVGYYIGAGNFMTGFSENDRKGGFAYEYLQNIAAYTDWEYEYIYGYWDFLYDKLLNGEIDLLTDVSYSKERESLFYYPDYEMSQEIYYIYSRKDDSSVSAEDLSTLNGKSMEVGINSYQYDVLLQWLKRHDIHMNLKESNYDDVSEDDFNNGVYDLYYSIDTVADLNWEPIVKIGSSSIYIAVAKNRPDILKELNEAQNSIYISNPYYNSYLWNKFYSHGTTSKRLNSKEKEWILQKNSMNVGCFENDNLYSPTDKDGNVTGLLAYLESNFFKFFNIPNLKFNYKFYKEREEIIAALKEGEIDIAFPFLYDLYNAELEKISLSQPVIPASFCYVYLDGKSYDEMIQKVALVKGKRASEFFDSSKIAKASTVKYYDTLLECFNAILIGEVNSAVVNTNEAASFLFGREKYKKLKMIDIESDVSLAFASDSKNTIAISLVNKMISMLNRNELHVQVIKNSLDENTYSFYDFLDDYIYLIIVLVLILLLLTVALGASFYYIKTLINYDVLTHLLNRRSLKNYIHRYINKADTQNESFCIVIFDLDNFKFINDTYGHEIGDEVLKTAAEIIQKSISLEDKVFRWGGEEFLVILNTNKVLAEKIANRIRINLAAHVFENNTDEFFVSLTGGLSEYKAGKEYTEMFVEADKNLYRGKELGKNVIIT